MTATTPSILNEAIGIEGISEPAVLQYFETFNSGDFEATANLFDASGVLNAPFADPIVGQSAIATYLKTEAQGMKLHPQQATSQALEDGETEFQVSGRVQTPLFSVNVGWRFVVNSQQQILDVTVKLLASAQELLNLRPLTKL